MDFFAHQDQARRASRRLVAWFVVAVIAVVVALDLVLVLVWTGSLHERAPWQAHAVVVGGALAVILGAALFKTWELRGGGRVVAEQLGGRPVSGDESPMHRRLVNVVEEMALASGTPMPAVYVLESEDGINAFAAGHQAEDAVVAVTRGALLHLPRPELQGVIGHEFSHILNGDMRLNLRLMGLVHGLMVLSEIGAQVIQGLSRSRPRSRNDKDGGGLAALYATGLALWAIGGIGAGAGGLIRAAISRRREFLADASAVQFTRDPSAIAEALKRIGGLGAESRLTTPRSGEVGHLLFGAGSVPWISWLATHPPLAERIRRLDPAWDGRYPATAALSAGSPTTSTSPAAAAHLVGPVVDTAMPRRIAADRIAAAVGAMPPASVSLAGTFLAELPAHLHAEVHEPVTARAVALAALCDPRPAVAALQCDAALRAADQALGRDLIRLRPQVAALGQRARLPLIDLAAPALRQLTAHQRVALLQVARQTAWGAGEPALSVFCLLRHIELVLSDGRMPSPRLLALNPFLPHAAVVLAHLARSAGGDAATTRAAFAAAVHSLGITDLEWPADLSLERLGLALDACRSSAFGLRRRLVTAGAWSIAADGQVTVSEAEVLRLVATTVGCPLPFAS
jgi:Zn-dependent protease with chaperone function